MPLDPLGAPFFSYRLSAECSEDKRKAQQCSRNTAYVFFFLSGVVFSHLLSFSGGERKKVSSAEGAAYCFDVLAGTFFLFIVTKYCEGTFCIPPQIQ